MLSKNLPKSSLSQAETSSHNLQVKDDIIISKADNDWVVVIGVKKTKSEKQINNLMTKILAGLEGVVCMVDDIVTVGTTKEEHDKRLARILQKIEKLGMT